MTDPVEQVLSVFGQRLKAVTERVDAAREQSAQVGKGPLSPDSLRGQLIIAKALAYAMDSIDQLPKHKQEWSDRQDMANLLLCSCQPALADSAVLSAEAHTGRTLDVFDHKADPDDAA